VRVQYLDVDDDVDDVDVDTRRLPRPDAQQCAAVGPSYPERWRIGVQEPSEVVLEAR
jgi:hypothetical protein